LGVNSPLKKSFCLRAVEIHQLGVAKSRHIFGYACDSAPWSDEFCLALADKALFKRAVNWPTFLPKPHFDQTTGSLKEVLSAAWRCACGYFSNYR